MLFDVIEGRVKDDEQLFIEVDLPFLVDRIKINRFFVLDNCRLSGNGAIPVYLVQSAVHILHNGEDKVLVILSPLDNG